MKAQGEYVPINQIRSTHKFHILGGAVSDLVALSAHFGNTLVSVATDPNGQDGCDYVVRTAETGVGMRDVRVRVLGSVEVLESIELIRFDE